MKGFALSEMQALRKMSVSIEKPSYFLISGCLIIQVIQLLSLTDATGLKAAGVTESTIKDTNTDLRCYLFSSTAGYVIYIYLSIVSASTEPL